ncbi:MAG: DinB family protein [Terriglobales bacterium]
MRRRNQSPAPAWQAEFTTGGALQRPCGKQSVTFSSRHRRSRRLRTRSSPPHTTLPMRLSGREVLLAMYIHVAHHRGQAEIYLRDKGIKPPRYMI